MTDDCAKKLNKKLTKKKKNNWMVALMDLGNVRSFGVVGVLLDFCWRKNPRSLGSPKCHQPPGGRLTLTEYLEPDKMVVDFFFRFFSFHKQQTHFVAHRLAFCDCALLLQFGNEYLKMKKQVMQVTAVAVISWVWQSSRSERTRRERQN